MGMAMELTKKALEDVRFRTKGRWYSAEQVDAFIEELIVGADGLERETDRLRGEVRGLERDLEAARREAAGLREELEALRDASKEPPAPKPEVAVPTSLEHQRKVCGELERERDELIADIKVLRRFRETFREAVERDAKGLLGRLETLDSEKLL